MKTLSIHRAFRMLLDVELDAIGMYSENNIDTVRMADGCKNVGYVLVCDTTWS